MNDVLVIELWPPTCFCAVCGAETRMSWGVPVVNGDVVTNDYEGDDWGGVSVCVWCYYAQMIWSAIVSHYKPSAGQK